MMQEKRMQNTKIYKDMNIQHETNFTERELNALNKKNAVFRMENGKPIYRVFLENSIFEVRQTNDLSIYECVVADKTEYNLAYANGNSMNESIKRAFSRYLKLTKDDERVNDAKNDIEGILKEISNDEL